MTDLRLPWRLKPLGGKYYGTIIENADGDELMDIWQIPWQDHEGSRPSVRELATWSNPEEYEICDSHYECVHTYEMALAIVEKMNEA